MMDRAVAMTHPDAASPFPTTTATDIPAQHYVPEIDALRAIAVLSVMLFHLKSTFLPGGYSGVDVFFGISGYVISSSIYRKEIQEGATFFLRFYARRVLRILPALIVCLCVTNVLTTMFIPESWLSNSVWQTGRLAFVGLSNFALIKDEGTYFAPRAEFNPYTHTWSLGVEEQFYVIFPTIFFLWLVWSSSKKWPRWFGSALLPVLAVLSLAYSAYATPHDPPQAYYSLPSRFWELAAGALLFRLHVAPIQWRRRWDHRVRLVEFVGSFALVLLPFILSRESAFPFPWATATILGSVGLIDSLLSDVAAQLPGAQVFRSRLMVWIGKRSYSLYLWHWPICVLLRWTVGLESWPSWFVAVAATFLLAAASYRWVEQPIRHIALTSNRRRLLTIGVAVLGIIVAAGASARIHARRSSLSLSITAKNRVYWYPDAWKANVATNRRCDVVRTTHGSPNAGLVETYASGCARSGSRPRLFVTGNSHALAYRTLLVDVAESGAYDVRLYYHAGCTFLSLSEPEAQQPSSCREFYDRTLADVRMLGRVGDVLFLPALRLPRFTDQWARFPASATFAAVYGPRAETQRDQAVAEASRILKPATNAGVHVVFEAPKPIFGAPAFRCSDWFNERNPICASGLDMPRQMLLQLRRPVLESMRRLETENTLITVWDPFDVLCPGEVCHAMQHGKPLYFDGDHLSGYGNQVLYCSFIEFLDASSRVPDSGLASEITACASREPSATHT